MHHIRYKKNVVAKLLATCQLYVKKQFLNILAE